MEDVKKILEESRSCIVELCTVMNVPLPSETIQRIDYALSHQENSFAIPHPAHLARELPDHINDAIYNLVHDNYERSQAGSRNRQADADLIRAALAAPIAQTAPQPEQSGLVEVLNSLLSWAERQICTHEETHRGGAIWEICDACNAKWADDEGGKPEFKWPAAIEQARAALSAQRGEA